MTFDTQTILENDRVLLLPLTPEDFDALYAQASNPEVWEQHPTKNRWQKEVFENFFAGAIASKGAYKVMDKNTGQVIGSTRFYDHNPKEASVCIGYTFYGKPYWGKGFNPAVKKLMLEYAFQFVEVVVFHIGACNIRSQIAIGRLGAQQVGEEMIVYAGEQANQNVIYHLTKDDWRKHVESKK